MLAYRALFEPAEARGFEVTFPDFGYGVTQGDPEAETRAWPPNCWPACSRIRSKPENHSRKQSRNASIPPRALK